MPDLDPMAQGWMDEHHQHMVLRSRVAYLTGWYGQVADQGDNEQLGELVGELNKALDASVRGEGGESDG